MHPLQDNLHTLICRSMNPGVALQVSKLEKKKDFLISVSCYIIDDSNKTDTTKMCCRVKPAKGVKHNNGIPDSADVFISDNLTTLDADFAAAG